MEVSGWRLKGCGELKRGLKNYQQGRASIRCYPPIDDSPSRGTGRRRVGDKERDKERNEPRIRRGSIKSEPLRSLGTFFSV